MKSTKERIRRYHRYMYETGAVDRPDMQMAAVIDPRLLAREKKEGFQITIASRLRFRTRYFTDSGIIDQFYMSPKSLLHDLEICWRVGSG